MSYLSRYVEAYTHDGSNPASRDVRAEGEAELQHRRTEYKHEAIAVESKQNCGIKDVSNQVSMKIACRSVGAGRSGTRGERTPYDIGQLPEASNGGVPHYCTSRVVRFIAPYTDVFIQVALVPEG